MTCKTIKDCNDSFLDNKICIEKSLFGPFGVYFLKYSFKMCNTTTLEQGGNTHQTGDHHTDMETDLCVYGDFCKL